MKERLKEDETGRRENPVGSYQILKTWVLGPWISGQNRKDKELYKRFAKEVGKTCVWEGKNGRRRRT